MKIRYLVQEKIPPLPPSVASRRARCSVGEDPTAEPAADQPSKKKKASKKRGYTEARLSPSSKKWLRCRPRPAALGATGAALHRRVPLQLRMRLQLRPPPSAAEARQIDAIY